MSGSTQLSRLMPRRYEELEAVLQGRGFDIATNTHPARPNEWRDDPPLGLVRIKGIWLPGADEKEDPEPDPRVTFSMMERWSEEHPDVEASRRARRTLPGRLRLQRSHRGRVRNRRRRQP